jgi:hypothetical protein
MREKHEEFDAKKHFAILKAALENRDEAIRKEERLIMLDKINIILNKPADPSTDGFFMFLADIFKLRDDLTKQLQEGSEKKV